MQLAPGEHKIDVNGKFERDIFVGNQGGTYQVTEGDQGLLVGGILATGFGVTGVLVGGVFTIVGGSADDENSTSYSSSEEDSGSDLAAVGRPLLYAGVPLLVAGIVMLASAEQPGVAETTTFARSSSVPFVGVAPVEGGAMMGAAMRF